MPRTLTSTAAKPAQETRNAGFFFLHPLLGHLRAFHGNARYIKKPAAAGFFFA
jgi:hypothetical protein